MNEKKYIYNRLQTSINLTDAEMQLIEKIAATEFSNKNQLVARAIRDYLKKYTSDTPPASEISAFSHSDNQNNSIDDLKNSINNLNQSINILIERLPDKNN
ncbi:hypothetical protein [uncultured Brachyspira sp.]|uniref:hypothetical protein n=1 Tax=uncultured Brachyspira sp. TaxID=221953 RepID=UPI00260A967E|nr:hypothetical protein [uncultured Brachyspira sp.]